MLSILVVSFWELQGGALAFFSSCPVRSGRSASIRSVLTTAAAIRDHHHHHDDENHHHHHQLSEPLSWQCKRPNRRAFFLGAATTWMVATSSTPAAWAGIDMNVLKSLPVEGDQTGVATRLRQVEADRNRPGDTIDQPYVELPSGVSYREYRDGKGTAVVQPGSAVAAEMTIRCKSFSTQTEPGGVKYFDSRADTEFNEVAFVVGSGEILPGLEEGMAGMHRGSIRRIEVPSMMVFAAKKGNQLPLPSDKNKEGKRRFESLFKTDATLMFEVLVTRIK